MKFALGYEEGLTGHLPAMRTAWDLYSEEMAPLHKESAWPWNPQYSFMALTLNGDVVCFIAFVCGYKEADMITICGAWTDPRWRGRGIYASLLGIFLNEMEKRPRYKWLMSGFHKDNAASRHIQLEVQKREIVPGPNPDFIRTRMALKATGEEFEMNETVLRALIPLFQAKAA